MAESLCTLSDLEQHKPYPPLGPAPKVLMVCPVSPRCFWTFEGMMEIVPEHSLIPPLGLITVAALCPKHWEIRLVDHSFEELKEADVLWADLVMVSAMNVQREDALRTLGFASKLGRRTIIGGPYASSEPEALLPFADHVVVGEPDESFSEIAADLESGFARRLYRIREKPDVRKTPIPRFDLLKLNNYTSMSLQFSRGCPFTCEFCDIITIYGRRPRTKSPAQMTGELDALLRLGWRKPVFLVDDNFIGNHKAALELVKTLQVWQQREDYPCALYTEASVDLASRIELLDAMVKANFVGVFLGIESPSSESLKEAKKFQNVNRNLLDCIRTIQEHGLWVMGGFIIGFDSDPKDIFEQQVAFIKEAAIPWAMPGFLQAIPTTPLYDRMKVDGRLLQDRHAIGPIEPPNFKTLLPLPELTDGFRRMLLELYSPGNFYDRAIESLQRWKNTSEQRAPAIPFLYGLKVLVASLWQQGIRSRYRWSYLRFMSRLVLRWGLDSRKMWLGFVIAMSGHHFIVYSQDVADSLEEKTVWAQPEMEKQSVASV